MSNNNTDSLLTQNTSHTYIKIILSIIVAIFIVFAVIIAVPLTVNYPECYKSIAKEECDDRTLVIDTYYLNSFKCCDYSKVDNTSRKELDRMPYCETYVYLEEDNDKCSVSGNYFQRHNNTKRDELENE